MNLNYTAPINSLGYGVVGLNMLLGLDKIGVNAQLWPIGSIECPSYAAQVVQKSLDTRCDYDKNAPSLRIWHQHDMAQHVGKGLHIGFPIFELDKFTKLEYNEMSRMDALFVCSHWAKKIVEEELGHERVFVCPLGVDREIFNEGISNNLSTTTFVNIGKWEYRKGHDIIVEAFNKAFKQSDKVRLLMCNTNPFLQEQQVTEWVNLYKESPLGDKIDIIGRLDTQLEVAQLMGMADCGVFPSRAEGWNLELLEMMSMGKQVITTNYSAHTEFCNSDNAMLIEITESEDAFDNIFFDGESGGQWARIGDDEIDALVHHMRSVHSGEKTVNNAGIETAKQLTWDKCAGILTENIKKGEY